MSGKGVIKDRAEVRKCPRAENIAAGMAKPVLFTRCQGFRCMAVINNKFRKGWRKKDVSFFAGFDHDLLAFREEKQ